MAIDKQASCDDVFEPELLPVSEAIKRMAAQINPVTESVTMPLRQSLGRIVAAPVVSPIDVPAYTNSAMDGFAISSDDLPSSGEKSLRLLGTAWAGKPLNVEVGTGQAVRIMTGGMMPAGTDTVVIQEHASMNGDDVLIDGSTAPGKNVRMAGEDITAGELIIETGTQVDPAHIGLMASLGIDQVTVFRQLKVAFFSTGDELRALESHAGKSLGPGELFDSNRHTLFAMLQRLGVETIDLGVVADTPEATREAFSTGARQADLMISSGGVSAGQADYVSSTLAELGDVTFWKLAMRPGRPLACGKVGDAHFFGLPGNPVAVMVAFYEFVQPSIRRMQGCSQLIAPRFAARCESKLRKSPGRIEYQRGIFATGADGHTTVRSTGKQGAGRLSSMCMANCLIVIAADKDGVEPGDIVQIEPFHGLV